MSFIYHPESLTENQKRLIFVLMRKLEMDYAADFEDEASSLFKREVAHVDELTKHEASRFIEYLKGELGEE